MTKPTDAALAALLDGPPTNTRTRIMEAVSWPGEGYGAGTRCENMAQAASAVRVTANMGYGANPTNGRAPHRIHVTRTTVETWEVPVELCEAIRKEGVG